MKKLTLFLVASVMLSSTFLSASCGDDEDEVKNELEQKLDEWATANTLDSDDSYYLYKYDEDLVYKEEDASQVNPGTTPTLPGDINYQSVDAKAQILNEKDIKKFESIDAMKALEVEAQIDPTTQNCLTAAILLAQIQAGQILAIDINGKKIVAKATNVDRTNKSVHVTGYALVPKN
ncbi:MAG: hypothetical protein J6Y24_11705 [Bacteroidales bacterium]|nr:hypothetical protein [Bacteroidales bacterium]